MGRFKVFELYYFEYINVYTYIYIYEISGVTWSSEYKTHLTPLVGCIW